MPKRVLDPSLLRALNRARSETAGDSPGDPAAGPSGRAVYDNLGIRIDRDGIWYYHGSAIHRKELVCLFASALERDEDGRYWLVTPSELGPVEVEDAPFLAVELFIGGRGHDQKISFRTNVDEIVTVGGEHRLFVITDGASGEPSPYVQLPRRREARFNRAVYYELVGFAEPHDIEGKQQLGVWSSGLFFPLGPAGDWD